ncbi:MAG: TRAP transporter small permease [Planctomycetes bacterium]|nr:TRAP transporter small permease [Planctomycetota bacterium]
MKILRWLDRHAEESVMIGLVAAMVTLMSVQIFMRYALAASLSWPEELIRYLFIWFVFMGVSYGVRENIHLRVDLLEYLLPRAKPYLNVVQNLIFLAFCLYLFRPGWTAVRSLVRSGQTSAAMDLPMYLVYASLLVGLSLAVVRMAQKCVFAVLALRAHRRSAGVATEDGQ